MQTLNHDGSLRNSFNARGFIQVAPESTITIGCDVGVQNDFSTVVVLNRRREPITPENGGVGSDLIQRLGPAVHVVKDAEQLPLGIAYEGIAAHLVEVAKFWASKTPRRVQVCVDVTGARPLTELARKAGLNFQPVTITSGQPDAISYDKAGWLNVSKSAIVTTLDAMLTARELFLEDESIPGVAALRRELLNLQMQRSVTGMPRWNAAGSGKDDLVMGLGIAAVVTRHVRPNRVSAQPLRL